MKEFAQGLAIALGLMLVGALVCFAGGCASPSVSEPKYPEYRKWWTCHERNFVEMVSAVSVADGLWFQNAHTAHIRKEI